MSVNVINQLGLLLVAASISCIGCNSNPSNNEQAKQEIPSAQQTPTSTPEEKEKPDYEPEDVQLSSDKNTIEGDLSDDVRPLSIDLPGYITGKGVLMRSSFSTQSSSKGTFKQFESVHVIEEYEPNNNNEGITKAYVKLYDEYGQHAETLNPGRAVKIIGREGSKYKVSFVSTKRRTLTASIDRSEIDMISGDKWYRVRRDNGETGWVFSKFLEFDIHGE
jgi:hypothetical protein